MTCDQRRDQAERVTQDKQREESCCARAKRFPDRSDGSFTPYVELGKRKYQRAIDQRERQHGKGNFVRPEWGKEL
jgi:hypothetical protein